MFNRTIMFILCHALYVLRVGDAFPIQSTQKENNRFEQQSTHNLLINDSIGLTVSSKTTPLPLFDCFGPGICQVGIHFCNDRKKVCEKCEDYQHACGTNYQPVNCTQYCMDFLVKRKCNDVVTSVPTILPTTTETTETSKLGAFAEKPECGYDWKWTAIAILVTIVVPSLVGNVFALYHYFNGCARQSTQKEYNEPKQKLLPKDCPVSLPVDTSDSFDYISTEYINYPSEDNNSELPSASFIEPPDNSDQDQTSLKLNNKHLPSRENQGSEHEAALKEVIKMKVINDVQGRKVDIDNQASSGYSSDSSNPSPKNPHVINNKINIKIFNGPSDQSNTVMKADKDATEPENAWHQTPYGVKEVGTADYGNAKPISDVDQNAKIALPQASIDIDDLKNKSHNGRCMQGSSLKI